MRYTPLLLSAIFIAPASYAELSLNGFLSAVGGQALDEPVRQYEEDFTFTQDTLFGLQARADLSDKLSVTGQIVSRGEDDYKTELAWGYMAYQLNESLTARMGRFRTPFYSYSDFIEVGYAYPWIAPADEVYALQFDNIDGFDVLYSAPLFGDLSVDLQFYAGAVNDDFELEKAKQTLDMQTRNHAGLAATFYYGDFSLRASTHSAKLTAQNFDSISSNGQTIAFLKTSLDSAQALIGQAALFDAIKSDLAIDDLSTTFTQFGFKYDGEYVFLVSELTELDFDGGPAADQKRMHASLGFHWGSATLYTSYAKADDEAANLTKGLEQFNSPQLTPLITALETISETLSITSETTSVGIRYDFDAGAAFKIQYDQISTPSATSDKDDNNGLIRFGVDLVF